MTNLTLEEQLIFSDYKSFVKKIVNDFINDRNKEKLIKLIYRSKEVCCYKLISNGWEHKRTIAKAIGISLLEVVDEELKKLENIADVKFSTIFDLQNVNKISFKTIVEKKYSEMKN